MVLVFPATAAAKDLVGTNSAAFGGSGSGERRRGVPAIVTTNIRFIYGIQIRSLLMTKNDCRYSASFPYLAAVFELSQFRTSSNVMFPIQEKIRRPSGLEGWGGFQGLVARSEYVS